MPQSVHGSCVRWLDRGILLRGPSGSGKSDLALRLIDAGGELVADDVVILSRLGGGVRAEAPETGRGLIELRHIGIFRTSSLPSSDVDCIVDLFECQPSERFAPRDRVRLLDVELPRYRLWAYPGSAVAQLRVIMSAERVA